MRYLSVLFFALFCLNLIAQRRTGKDYALFFTVSTYENSNIWPNLTAIPNEIKSLGKILNLEYGFNVKVVENATRSDIENLLREYNNRNLYNNDSQLLIFFSMHGQRTNQGNGYLIPKEGTAEVSTWLPHSQLSDIINTLPCPRILVSIDACYSGTFGDNRSVPISPSWDIANIDCQIKREMAFQNKRPSRKYLTAGRAEQRVPSSSMFVKRWQAALNSKGGEDGILSFVELWGYLYQIDGSGVIPTNGVFGSDNGGDWAMVYWADCIPPISESELNMVFIKGGTYEMGCTSEQKDCEKKDFPVYEVTVPDFYIGKYEVTKKLWKKIMGEGNINYADCDEYYIDCDECPIVNVSYNDVQEFLKRITYYFPNEKFRLPNAAEWEYAARSGGKKFRFGNGTNVADPKLMNFDCSLESKTEYSIVGKFRNRILPVGSFPPNLLGLYDMSGNVWEWYHDWDHYEHGYSFIPPDENTDLQLVYYRGGSFNSDPYFCQVHYYYFDSPPDLYFPSLGFRIAFTHNK